MSYQHIVFDLDGTLTDPKIGITSAIRFALSRMGYPEPPAEELLDWIGPPLFDSFIDKFSMTPAQALKAVDYYREYYSDRGLYENHPYQGVEALLKKLQADGVDLYVATSKPEVYARKILDHFGLSDYFRWIAGSTLDGRISRKEDVLDYLTDQCLIGREDSVLMVGDRRFDVEGARHAGFDSGAVLYGYGSREELEYCDPNYIFESPEHILKILEERKNRNDGA